MGWSHHSEEEWTYLVANDVLLSFQATGELNQASENWSKPKDLCMSTIFVVSVGSLCPVKARLDIVSRNPCYTPAVYSKSNEEVQNDLQRKHWCYNSGVWMPSCNTDWMKRTVKLLNYMGSCGCPPWSVTTRSTVFYSLGLVIVCMASLSIVSQC